MHNLWNVLEQLWRKKLTMILKKLRITEISNQHKGYVLSLIKRPFNQLIKIVKSIGWVQIPRLLKSKTKFKNVKVLNDLFKIVSKRIKNNRSLF